MNSWARIAITLWLINSAVGSSMSRASATQERFRGDLPGPNPALFRSRLERTEFAERDGGEHVGKPREIGRHLRKIRSALAPPLVHIDRAVELELDGVQAARGVAVMLGDEAAGIGLVAP